MRKGCNRWYQWLKRLLCRVLLVIFGGWLVAILVFCVLPVPFSAVMLERQISAWWHGEWDYRVHSKWVSMDEIAPVMALAVIAAEDQKFPQHWGFDLDAIQQALAHNAQASTLRGASTLSQQTAKNLLLWNGRSWLRKTLEAGLTMGIEAIWSKKRILTVYLNIAEFGDGIFGVEAAAVHYFQQSASELTTSQAAWLAAVLPNPLRYKVNAPTPWLYNRQQWILRQMQQLGGMEFLQSNKLR